MIDESPEPVKLPSPDEIMEEYTILIASAQIKLQKLGLTLDEAKAVIGIR